MLPTLRSKTTDKELLSLYRKALTAISKMKLNNVRVKPEIMFHTNDGDNFFNITCFKPYGDNCTFNFYSFTSFTQNEENLERVLPVIKTDDFQEINSTHINH